MKKSKPTDREPKPPTKSILERRKSEVWKGVSYHLRLNRNAKTPYWYAYWYDSEAKKTKGKYLGKEWRELTEEDFK